MPLQRQINGKSTANQRQISGKRWSFALSLAHLYSFLFRFFRLFLPLSDLLGVLFSFFGVVILFFSQGVAGVVLLSVLVVVLVCCYKMLFAVRQCYRMLFFVTRCYKMLFAVTGLLQNVIFCYALLEVAAVRIFWLLLPCSCVLFAFLWL